MSDVTDLLMAVYEAMGKAASMDEKRAIAQDAAGLLLKIGAASVPVDESKAATH
jgi:hypothetical protein